MKKRNEGFHNKLRERFFLSSMMGITDGVPKEVKGAP